MDYTPSQAKAISEHPKGNLLVSASAGSGKTRVLVDRVTKMIVEDERSIDELLIVTFTKAATKEMKERLENSLKEAYQLTDYSELKNRLLNEIQKIPVANISTFDAFCQSLIARYYYVLGIDPKFRILSDQIEIELLKDQVWDNVREDLYGAKDSDGFKALVDNFSEKSDRSDDKLTEVVYKMYEFSQANENPTKWLQDSINIYQGVTDTLEGTKLLKEYLKLVENEFQELEIIGKQAMQIANDNGLEKDVDYLKDNFAFVSEIDARLNDSWDNARSYYNKLSLGKMPSINNMDDTQTAAHEIIKKLKKDSLKILNNIKKYFILDEKDTIQNLNQTLDILTKLTRVVEEFTVAYQKEKQAQNLMEFIDIEHAAYDLLNSDHPESPKILKKLQTTYYEILVDEYQDNNRLQDAILDLISLNNNRFMVGDVKQSIYKFRLARPEMFTEKQIEYVKNENEHELINLSENFRSNKNITDFVNLIFTQIMDTNLGEIDYDESAQLKFGASYYPEELQSQIEILLYKSDEKETDSETENATEAQSIIVAQKIQELIENQTQIYDRKQKELRPINYGDIAVISETKTNDLVYHKIFSKFKIPSVINKAEEYFKTTEIQIMMSLLSIIDNPYQDIPLVAVLRSPIVGLDENQLASIRITNKSDNYYTALLDFYNNYQETNAYNQSIFQKLERFLNQLQLFKDLSRQVDLVTLIWRIYEETGFLDYVGGMPNGYQRQTNLHALYQRAEQYEKSNFKGLFQFVRFIKRMQDKDKDLNLAIPTVDDNSVKLMTIHGSKGLEFPVVFLNNVSKQFNNDDQKQNYILNEQLGIGIKYFDKSTRLIEETLPFNVIKAQLKKESLAEEMRKLYVALTRAEQHLFLVGSLKGDINKAIAKHQTSSDPKQLLLPNSIRQANSLLDWVLMSVARHPQMLAQFGDSVGTKVLNDDQTQFKLTMVADKELHIRNDLDTKQKSAAKWIEELSAASKQVPASDETNDINRYLDFDYPFKVATKTTAYQSVSEIKRLFDDPYNLELGEMTLTASSPSENAGRYLDDEFKAPQFMQTSVAPKATDVGTATHLVLQKIDLGTPPTKMSLDELINKLIKDQVLTQTVGDLINREDLLALFNTPLGQALLGPNNHVEREVPFSLLLDAKNVFTGFENDLGQSILVHGIIDGYIISGDQVILFDYKTDHVNNFNTAEKIKQRYQGQLAIYEKALANILNQPINHKYLYLLSNNDLVKL